MEEGMRGGEVCKQKDRQRTPVSFAIVSDHLPSFSILSMDSYDMVRTSGGAREGV
jgi:hypothetical protein